MNIKCVFTICLLAISASVLAQNTSGKVYAGDKRVPGVLVENRTQNKSTVTTDAGDFSIAARLNDSLVFSAPFMETQVFIVEQSQLEQRWVVALNENLNELDEVRLTEAPKPKEFNQEEYTAKVNNLVRRDYELNPQEYRPKYATNGIDFIMLAKRFASLFKKDPSKKTKDYGVISYERIQQLFASDAYFDEKFLRQQLKIEAEYQNLFFEYVGAVNLDGILLEPEHQLDLLKELLALSESFNAEIKKFKEEGATLPGDN
ncbi:MULTISPECIES: hypothetical protein [unclassified Leeuwenhoekiella]|uniref:hypothetical protein n=1 Tax=unclassified Leeuwenhoekiella TaxID=2615029 RepID=UPI000C61146B|nr:MULTISPECIES: hypothetical protein [unclassified Leeuwenhoekiella]MAW97121.1 hypothetical protein [Leeuwenhoekiella sp.]MBA82637.1 hypothetical protein [Leeuwenhoekiella sp.]|tara:strand:- start:16311 stop:17090 length:780 start_codon:yes stop_codon:yes gene_type:complete